MMPKPAPLVESNKPSQRYPGAGNAGKDFSREAAYFENSDKMWIAGSTSKIAATN
jgi:hypothetical protein